MPIKSVFAGEAGPLSGFSYLPHGSLLACVLEALLYNDPNPF